MKSSIYLLVVGVLPYVQSELVWLQDVTSSFQTDKRTLSDLDLPDDLTFHLIRGSHVMGLNLKRNHGIDPNADAYFVRKLKDGRSHLKKTRNLEKKAVAYYQDRENWAFMTVRCIKRSNGQCDRVINGNIRIGDINYDLRPAESDVTSRNLLDIPDLLVTRYVLRDQANIQREISVENKDAANVHEKNVEQELVDLLRRFPHGQDNQSHFPFQNSKLTGRNVASLHNIDKKNNVKQVYSVEIVVLIDSGIWDLFSSLYPNNPNKEKHVESKIKEAYSHIINGVNLLYNKIEDPSIEISVTLRKFYIFQRQQDFPHFESRVRTVDGKKYIDVEEYLHDMIGWDENFGSNYGIDFGHAMLFTKYDLYRTNAHNNDDITGMSYVGEVCDIGGRISVVQQNDFFLTTSTAAHELGHNLGADHDGDGNAAACRTEDLFIMSRINPRFNQTMPYSRNPWIFSNCSVEAFKKTLQNKTCLSNNGVCYNEEEWTKRVMKLPGEVYSYDNQCAFANGPNSVFCGVVAPSICRFMKCTDPKMGKCLEYNFSAAEGTTCGVDMVQTAVCYTQQSMKSEKVTGLLSSMI